MTLMFRAGTLILVFVMLLQSFSSLVIIAGYELNKEYISKTLCENKNKPAMHCNGKCHMQKQLKEQSKKDQSPVSTSKEKQETVQFFENPFSISFDNFSPGRSYNISYTEMQPQPVVFSFFHPPAC